MGNMPEWFAKTAEMCASDRYFSLADAGDELELAKRYLAALKSLEDDKARPYLGQSAALDDAVTDKALKLDAKRVKDALTMHFVGDWIHAGYQPGDPTTHSLGGRYWPTIPSSRVVSIIKVGTQAAILKALGEKNLRRMGFKTPTIDALFVQEKNIGVATSGIRPMATSWNCVAPAGSNFFHANALRGPSIVELAIATPKPNEISEFGETIDRAARGEFALSVPNPDFEIATDVEPDPDTEGS